jgi:hypothetical protein
VLAAHINIDVQFQMFTHVNGGATLRQLSIFNNMCSRYTRRPAAISISQWVDLLQ